MSNRWLPKWKIVEIEVNNKPFEVCYDETLKIYACPLCSPSCKSGGIPDYSSYFFHTEDLIRHINAHKYNLWTKKRPIEFEEEDEGEENNEED
ncbi:hypothetical protein [Acidianus brierleyi]|uniref:Uncharacterized protein n=1 Tax=Acidianus brierleyi TaxID=41673 RepID=A0A2U9IE47_9CREN|nr:hypothetical protein [Acidianus brierleyi]AWR94313.1 hypothetical protein DFR85_06605 [Acidianus brierleyi]